MKTKRYSIPERKLRDVKNKSNGVCFYCGIKLPQDTQILDEHGKEISSKRNWHVDHVIPLCNGGTYDVSNLVASCSSCNINKGAK